jgi:hypothetical protein
VLITCWSVKGGSGCSTVAAALALLASATTEALAVDLRGDLVPLLGVPDRTVGLSTWCRAFPEVATDGLSRIETPSKPGLAVLQHGDDEPPGLEALDALVALLLDDPRPVVVDVGTDAAGLRAFATASDLSILVTQPCYVSCARLGRVTRPSGLVTVRAPWHAISDRDLEEVVGAPVLATVPFERSIGVALDAGMLVAGLPRSLRRNLASVLA